LVFFFYKNKNKNQPKRGDWVGGKVVRGPMGDRGFEKKFGGPHIGLGFFGLFSFGKPGGILFNTHKGETFFFPG